MGLDFILIDQSSTEWEYLWDWISKHPINEGLENPTLAFNDGEGWEYTGSFTNGTEYIHSCRHRLHPVTNNVQYLSLRGSKDMNDSMIALKK